MSIRSFAVAALVFLAAAAAGAQTFSGTVRNAAGGPLADMTVQAYNPAGFPVTTTTNSQGGYFLGVSPGTYRLVAYDNSGTYAVSFGGAPSFEQSEAINLSAGQGATVNFVLPLGVKIEGFVGSAISGAALHGAVVAAYNLDGSRRTFVTTNADGSYNLTVPPGSYKIASYHDVTPLIPTFFQNRRLFEEAVVVTPPASDVNFGLAPGTKLLGRVREQHSGLPLAGLSAVAYDLQGNVQFRTESKPSGDFAFVLPPGSYKFSIEDVGGRYQTTFFKDATSFAAGAAVSADSAAPLLEFAVGRIPDAEPKTTLYVPVIIHGAGQEGTFFKSDVWIQNPGESPLTVTATFLAAGAGPGMPVVVPARGQVHLEDLVQSFFGTSGAGALRLEADAPFRATSRTYNVPPNADVTGTFGLSIPAQSVGGSLGRAALAGLAENAASRTNIGLMNPQPHALDVKVEVFSPNGVFLGSQLFPLEPGQWIQPSVLLVVGVGFDHAYAIVSSAGGSFFSYAAVVDNKSGDGTIILPSGD
ncbi:MAG TPA: carboxypeptidase-like regulatory domain-containing protein [Thermoanaerobaculia bacterium]|nr:carboxypeptidase-like regulatory domain-containing protein [Thermoanaerobaculia bacterium]